MARTPYPFKGQQNWFYNRIEPAHFHLNEVMFEMKSDRPMRLEFIADPDAFAKKHGLKDDALEALREVDIVKLNAAGGHPILGWTVILLLRMDRGDTHGPPPTTATSPSPRCHPKPVEGPPVSFGSSTSSGPSTSSG